MKRSASQAPPISRRRRRSSRSKLLQLSAILGGAITSAAILGFVAHAQSTSEGKTTMARKMGSYFGRGETWESGGGSALAADSPPSPAKSTPDPSDAPATKSSASAEDATIKRTTEDSKSESDQPASTRGGAPEKAQESSNERSRTLMGSYFGTQRSPARFRPPQPAPPAKTGSPSDEGSDQASTMVEVPLKPLSSAGSAARRPVPVAEDMPTAVRPKGPSRYRAATKAAKQASKPVRMNLNDGPAVPAAIEPPTAAKPIQPQSAEANRRAAKFFATLGLKSRAAGSVAKPATERSEKSLDAAKPAETKAPEAGTPNDRPVGSIYSELATVKPLGVEARKPPVPEAKPTGVQKAKVAAKPTGAPNKPEVDPIESQRAPALSTLATAPVRKAPLAKATPEPQQHGSPARLPSPQRKAKQIKPASSTVAVELPKPAPSTVAVELPKTAPSTMAVELPKTAPSTMAVELPKPAALPTPPGGPSRYSRYSTPLAVARPPESEPARTLPAATLAGPQARSPQTRPAVASQPAKPRVALPTFTMNQTAQRTAASPFRLTSQAVMSAPAQDQPTGPAASAAVPPAGPTLAAQPPRDASQPEPSLARAPESVRPNTIRRQPVGQAAAPALRPQPVARQQADPRVPPGQPPVNERITNFLANPDAAPASARPQGPAIRVAPPAARPATQVARYQDAQPGLAPAIVQDDVPANAPFEVIEEAGEMKIQLGRSKLIRTQFDVYRTAIVDPSIVEVVQYTPNELSIVGKGLGSTQVTFWFEDATREPVTYLINIHPDNSKQEDVEREYQQLEQILQQHFPDSKVRLFPVADKLIVRGQAKDSQEAAQILAIIRAQVGAMGGAGGTFATLGGGTAARLYAVGQAGTQNLPPMRVINMLRVPGEHQVALRVKIAELNRSAARGFGVDVDANIEIDGDEGALLVQSMLNAATGNAPALIGQFDGDDIQLGLRYLQQQGVIRLLSEPTLVTLSGRPATFIAGGEFAVPTVVGTGGLNAVTTDFRAFGAIISFLPTVVDKDRIRLQVSPEFSQLNGDLTVGGTPGLNVRAVTTTVEMREGQTLAIAGLLDDTMTANNRSNLPFVGKIFGSRDATRNETELIILVTPELVHAMEPEEVPPLPGFDVTEPTDAQFYLHGRLEGNPNWEHRSTVWPRLRKRYGAGGSSMISGPFGHGQ